MVVSYSIPRQANDWSFLLAVSCSLRQGRQSCGCLAHSITPHCYCTAVRMSDSDSEVPGFLLHRAVRKLDVDALRRALAAGANVDALSVSGETPLYVACHTTPTWPAIGHTVTPGTWKEKIREREAIVAALLRAGANVNAQCSGGITPLKNAVWDRHGPPSDIVTQLIAAGADIEAADSNGFFPLYTAAQHGRGATVSQLLAAGADPHRRSVFLGGLRSWRLRDQCAMFTPTLPSSGPVWHCRA